MKNNLTRFSERVENYVRYRPDYPQGVADFLLASVDAEGPARVVDLGSGTGKLSQLFLERGLTVVGVEPNREMRLMAESLFSGNAQFTSVEGTAEATALADGQADLVTIGQALHWFDIERTRKECQRILAPGGRVAVVYNERRSSSPLLSAYEEFLYKHARSYAEVTHRHVDDSVFERFFGGSGYETTEMPNRQLFDFDGLLGRYESSSYAFTPSDVEYEAAVAALKELFERNESGGAVCFEYDTRVYVGPLR